jgi:hypothetical protein
MDFSGYRLENTWETRCSGGIIRSNRKTYQSLWALPKPLLAQGAFGSIRRDSTGAASVKTF